MLETLKGQAQELPRPEKFKAVKHGRIRAGQAQYVSGVRLEDAVSGVQEEETAR